MVVSQDIHQAVALLQSGKLVGIPTETVYGLAADAFNEQAVANVFHAKGRPADHPLIVHIGDLAQLSDVVQSVPAQAQKLIEAFWPGPLTLVLTKHDGVPSSVTAHQDTVAVRMPAHPMALQLLNSVGRPLVAPSANRYEHISPTTPEDVLDELGDKVSMVLDGGKCDVGIESTIVRVTDAQWEVLRPGIISEDDIQQVLAQPSQTFAQGVRVSGLKTKHYAPNTKTSLVPADSLVQKVQHHTSLGENVAVIAQSINASSLPEGITLFSMPMFYKAYAQQLYSSLRQADQSGAQVLLIEDVPHDAEWKGIRDRLVRASASL